MISPDRLERYRDFVDPERTGAPYDPRKGLERLMGILSPDTKGIVLAAMRQEWYGTNRQLRSGVFAWLENLGLSSSIWPIVENAAWSYCKYIKMKGEVVDGSLVELGAVVKKAEDPFQTLYSRSIAGAELAAPLVQQAVRFVSKAGEYAEVQRTKGKTTHKFDSMQRIIGSVGSPTDQRRPLAVWDIVDFLVHHPGRHRETDLHNETHTSFNRLAAILPSLGNCGVIEYTAPQTEIRGHKGRGWAVYILADRQSVVDLDLDKLYQSVRGIRNFFHYPASLTKVIDYIKDNPESEYERRMLAEKVHVDLPRVSIILSSLADLGILQQRSDSGFKGRKTQSSVLANDLTHLFHDLVCAPTKNVADTLSPPPLRSWDRREVAIYLENYNEERSQRGSQAGEDTRSLLLNILSRDGKEMKLSHIADLYNDQVERELRSVSIRHHLQLLLKSGQVEQPRPGYYSRVQK